MGDSFIYPSNSFLLTDIPEGKYDIKAVAYYYSYPSYYYIIWRAENKYLAGGKTYKMTLDDNSCTFSEE